ncbi:DUF6934 family protein [Emticicia fontis]
MTNNIYQTTVSSHFLAYDFLSEGSKGKILKGVRYIQTDISNVWNLGFGDINPITGEIDDTVISDNGDRDKVLATVAHTCIKFSEHFPEALIVVIGSTAARTRLYQMGINSNFDEISELFVIWGLFNESWELFEKNKNYTAFLAKRK